MDIAEFIDAFSKAVIALDMLIKRKATAQKLGTACRSFAATLGDGVITLDGVEHKGEAFTSVASYFDSLVSGEDAQRVELQKQASYLEIARDMGQIPDDAREAAELALAAWQQVTTTQVVASPKAPRLRAAS